MPGGFNVFGGERVALGERGQAFLGVLGVAFCQAGCVHPFLIGGEEATEGDDGAGCCELGIAPVGCGCPQPHGCGRTGGVCHLRGDGTFPDQLVQPVFVVGERAAHGVGGAEGVTCGADCFVRFLRVFALGGVGARRGGHVFGAVEFGCLAACRLHGLI